MARAGLTSLRESVFRIDFTLAANLTREIQTREGYYQKLLGFARKQVEELIPGSSSIKLLPQQESGLVRNLIFAHVAFGSSNPLLETEDFIKGKASYLEVMAGKQPNLAELMEKTGLPEEACGYIRDLSQQIAKITASAPALLRPCFLLSDAGRIPKAPCAPHAARSSLAGWASASSGTLVVRRPFAFHVIRGLRQGARSHHCCSACH